MRILLTSQADRPGADATARLPSTGSRGRLAGKRPAAACRPAPTPFVSAFARTLTTSPPSQYAVASPVLSLLQTLVEASATLAFAASGLLEAERKKLDPVGVCIVTGLAAFGGGTLRDILLDRRPFFWVAQPQWLWVIIGLSPAAMLFLRARHARLTERAMQWPDALGLGLFSASGTQIALTQGLPAIVAVLMGVITAAFGGVLRDIVCNEIPSALRDHRPYAICAFVGGWVVVGAGPLGLGVEPEWALALGAAVATALRVVALLTGTRLPGWSTQQDR